MSLAAISLIALAAAIAVGIIWRVNAGLLSIALALAVGVGLGGMKVTAVIAGFPSQLFLTLLAVTLLFGQAQVNGTLDKLATNTVRLTRGNAGVIAIMFFALAVGVATLGAGNIAATALLAPVAMAVAGRVGISAFLMTLMVANGANAGAFSPVAPTGIVAAELMSRAGLQGMEWRTYWNTFAAQSFVALCAFLLFGGVALLLRGRGDSAQTAREPEAPFTAKQRITLTVIAGLLAAVIVFKLEVIVGAFVGVAVLMLCRVADDGASFKSVPLNTIVMICGVTMLVAVLEKSGGTDIIVKLLAGVSSRLTVTAVVAFVAGLVSAYSSTIGVVLPTFLPTVPGLAHSLGADPMAIASSINVGGHLVDVSPLSTLGALCIAAAPPTEDRQSLFNKVLAWGLSMSVVGALVCFLFFGLLSRV